MEPGWGATFHRKDLDAALLARAQELGVSVLYDAPVKDVEPRTGRGFVVKTDGHFDIATRMLVGAYGTDAVLQRKFFELMGASLNPRYNFVAVAYRFIGDGENLEIPRHSMRLGAMQYVAQDGYVGSTYAWDWPAPGGRSNKGFGFFQFAHAREASNLSSAELMKRFFPEDASRIASVENEGRYKVRGARLPIYHPDSFAAIVIRNGGVIAVCGDSAGRINPVTGEGIAEALEDGEIGAALAKATVAGNLNPVRKHAFMKKFLRTEIYRRLSHAFASEFVLDHRHFQNFVDSLVTYPAFMKMFTGLVRGRGPASELLYSDARAGLMTMIERDPRILLTIPRMALAAFRI
jgi:flavin-dependent dehydrogenase